MDKPTAVAFVAMLLLSGACIWCDQCDAFMEHSYDALKLVWRSGAWMECSACGHQHFVGELELLHALGLDD